MTTGWTAVLKDGTVASESNGDQWSSVSGNVVCLLLSDGKQEITLPARQKRYVQGKSCSCCLTGGEVTIESRWIGFETPSGDTVKVRISESNGTVTVEV